MGFPEFPRRDPADPDFWNLRYEADFVPWDAGKVPEQLRLFAESRPPARVLVPGCGSAWDVRCFAQSGWDVTGIDFSPPAIEAARAVLGPFGNRVRQADFFAPIAEAPFDVVYERAFLCALPRRIWSRWAETVAALVKPGGDLAGFFYFDAGDRGPPFPLQDDAELHALLDPFFTRTADASVNDSIAIFAGKERWQVWRRR